MTELSSRPAPLPRAGDLGVTPETPWLGLRSFTEEVRDYFFGRDREIQELHQRVLHRPLTVLFGQSGLGKTSLLRAGLIPRLRDTGYDPILIRLCHDVESEPLEQQVVSKIHRWFIQTSWGRNRDPFPNIGLWQLVHDPDFGFVGPNGAAAVPATGPHSAVASTAGGTPPPPLRPVLIFDQFEEIFTQGEARRPADARAFLEALACLVENRPPAAIRQAIERTTYWPIAWCWRRSRARC